MNVRIDLTALELDRVIEAMELGGQLSEDKDLWEKLWAARKELARRANAARAKGG